MNRPPRDGWVRIRGGTVWLKPGAVIEWDGQTLYLKNLHIEPGKEPLFYIPEPAHRIRIPKRREGA